MIKDFFLYLQSVRELGIPYLEFKGLYTLSFKLGQKKYFIRGTDTPFNDGASVSLARNKYSVSQMLGRAKFPIPKTMAITVSEYRKGNLDLKGLKFPLVIKPTVEGGNGFGVVCNIPDEVTLCQQLDLAFQYYTCMSIEEFHGGLNSYRVLVFYGEVLAIIERTPVQVIGTGSESLQQLIEQKNQQEPAENQPEFKPFDINNQEFQLKLKQEGMTLDSVMDRGKVMNLRYVSSLGQGGTSIARGVEICLETAELLRDVAERLNLNLVGFDLLCEDIKKPLQKGRDVIVGITHNPEIASHEEPMSGEGLRVTKTMLSRFSKNNQPFSLKSWLSRSKLTRSFYFRAALIVFVLVVVFKYIF